MKNIFRIEQVNDYCKLNNIETLHPLVSIIDYSKTEINYTEHSHFYYGVYAIFLKETDCGELRYGRNSYDYQEGSLVFVQPGQMLELVKSKNTNTRKGWALMFHPDLILGTDLAKRISEYTFFSYAINEALHTSERERKMIIELFDKIQFEINQPIDKHSRKLIINNIQLFLDYCLRFYDRQFIMREHANKGILEKFENELQRYFKSNKPQLIGLPSVAHFADLLHLSANYFGDLIKKETGKTAQEFIQLQMMHIAKDKVLDISKPLNEVAYELGFKYPQHFTRMFKKNIGISPSEFRNVHA
ncbi:MAG: helix-turn-helix domain-containing protein [Mangrovibacterium sp.]